MDKDASPGEISVVGRKIRAADICGVFRGSEAVAAGVLTADQLRGSQFRRLYRDVYLPAAMPVTHPVCCEGIALALPTDAVITGRSAATLRGVPLARATDPVEIVVPLETRIARRTGVDVGAPTSLPMTRRHGRESAWPRRYGCPLICSLTVHYPMLWLTWTPWRETD